jgi:membrane protein implicated in regulation of membrane protease activity
MADWMVWLAAAGVLVVLELFSGTFYLLMMALGLAFGALAAWLGGTMPVQTIVAALVGIAATSLLHRSRLGRKPVLDAARDQNVNMDIGQRVAVDIWRDGHARVMYRGALWDVDLGPGAQPASGDFRIIEVQGSRLIVANA